MGNRYQFRLKGHLDESWAEWLSDMSIDHQHDGTTLITGQVADQAALFGVLSQLRDLGMPLLSVNVLGSDDRATREAGAQVCIEKSAGIDPIIKAMSMATLKSSKMEK